MNWLRKTKRIILVAALLCIVNIAKSQTYQYLKVVVDTSYNLDIVEMDWLANNITYPQAAMTGWNQPSPLEVTGDRANWERTQLYDNTNLDCRVGDIGANDPIKHEFTLNLGSGNGILPDSLHLQKTNNSVLARLKVLLSNDEENWFLFLDTTIGAWQWSTATFPLSRIPDFVPPSKPLNINSTYKNSSSFHFGWNKSTDNFAIQHYNVFKDNQFITSTTETHFVMRNLMPGSQTAVFVQAVDGDDNISENSDTLLVTTFAPDNTAPQLLGGLFASSISSDKIALKWTSATDHIGLSGYLISVNGTYTASSDSAYTVLSGLSPETSYQIQVVAKDRNGNVSSPISQTFQTQTKTEGMTLGTNFWRQQWSPDNNQLFNNGFQNVTEENPWKPQLIADLEYAKTLRFMEMQQINIAPLDNWLLRQKKEDIEQEDLAYEWMIDLCNRTQKNLWICIPWNVIDSNGIRPESNGLITKMAILLKTGVDMGDVILNEDSIGPLNQLTANDFLLLGGKKTTVPLNPGLKIFLEYGNENWNWNFPQTTHCSTNGQARGYGGPVRASRIFNAYASLESFKAFARVFGSDASRIDNVLPIQRVDLFHTYFSLVDIFDNLTLNPNLIYPNIVSGATYFSNQRNGNDPNIFNQMEDDINTYVQSISEFKDSMTSWGSARNINLRLVSYEGGHHITNNFNTINTDSNIYDTYIHFLDTMSYYFEEIELYNHVAYNAFGLKASVDQPLAEAHKFRAVLNWHREQAPNVDFTQLEGVAQDSHALLSWTMLNELSNAPGFTLWHSLDGVNFDSITHVSSQLRPVFPSLYSFTDSSLSEGIHYYMISQSDGVQQHYSSVIGVCIQGTQQTGVAKVEKDQVLIYPNPTENMLNLKVPDNLNKTSLSIYAMDGKEIMTFHAIPSQINLSELKSGVYFIQLQNKTIRIIKK